MAKTQTMVQAAANLTANVLQAQAKKSLKKAAAEAFKPLEPETREKIGKELRADPAVAEGTERLSALENSLASASESERELILGQYRGELAKLGYNAKKVGKGVATKGMREPTPTRIVRGFKGSVEGGAQADELLRQRLNSRLSTGSKQDEVSRELTRYLSKDQKEALGVAGEKTAKPAAADLSNASPDQLLGTVGNDKLTVEARQRAIQEMQKRDRDRIAKMGGGEEQLGMAA